MGARQFGVLVIAFSLFAASCFSEGRPVDIDDADLGKDLGGVADAAQDASSVDAAHDDVTSADTSQMGDEDMAPDAESDMAQPCVPFRCPVIPGTVPSCVDELYCAYQCDDGFVDRNGDLQMSETDGCECEQSAAEDAKCDGIDEDCDGVPDDDAPMQACPQLGVCRDATVACVGGEYPTCDETLFATLPDWLDTEIGFCDGLDNDCDGTADERCCAPSTTPAGLTFGSGPFVALGEPATNAPGTTAFALMTATSEEIRMDHLNQVGTSLSVATASDIFQATSVAFAAEGDRYAVLATEDRNSGVHAARLYVYDNMFLSLRFSFEKLLEVTTTGTYRSASAASNSTTSCFAWVEDGPTNSAWVNCWPIGSTSSTTMKLGKLTEAEDTVENIALGVVGERIIALTDGAGGITPFSIAADGASYDSDTPFGTGPATSLKVVDAGAGIGIAVWSDGAAVHAQKVLAADGSGLGNTVSSIAAGGQVAGAVADGRLILALGGAAAPRVTGGTTTTQTITTVSPIIPFLELANVSAMDAFVGEQVVGVAVSAGDGATFFNLSFEGTPICL